MVLKSTTFSQLHDGLNDKAKALGLEVQTIGKVTYEVASEAVSYPLIKLVLGPESARVLLIDAGIHGEEIAGPLSLLEYLEEIVAYAKERGVGLIIYPCINPSAFDAKNRYNRKGEMVENDFLRYVRDHALIGDLRKSADHDSWVWSSDPLLNLQLSEEMRLFHQEFKRLPLKSVLGHVDLHQDYYREDVASYFYVFGTGEEYAQLAKESDRLVPLLRGTPINSGYKKCPPEEMPHTDEHGLVRRHDGSIADLFHRLGVPYVVTVETTGKTEFEAAMRVNVLWIKGFIDLIARRK